MSKGTGNLNPNSFSGSKKTSSERRQITRVAQASHTRSTSSNINANANQPMTISSSTPLDLHTLSDEPMPPWLELLLSACSLLACFTREIVDRIIETIRSYKPDTLPSNTASNELFTRLTELSFVIVKSERMFLIHAEMRPLFRLWLDIDTNLSFKKYLIEDLTGYFIDTWKNHYRSGRLQDALRTISYAINLDPTSYNLRYYLGLTYLVKGMSSDAIDTFGELAAHKPDDFRVQFYLGSAYEAAQKYQEALNVYDNLERSHAPFSELSNNRGYALFKLGKFEKAIGAFNHSISLRKDNFHAWFNRALTCINLKDFNTALYSLQNALRSASSKHYLAEIYFNMSLIYVHQGRYSDIIRILASVLNKFADQSPDDLTPKLADLYSMRGLAYGKQELYDKAMSDYERAIALNPGDFAALNNKGIACRRMGHIAESLDCYNQVITIRGTLAETLNNMGNVFADQKRFEAAIDHYEKAIELAPQLDEPHYNLSLIKHNSYQYAKAELRGQDTYWSFNQFDLHDIRESH